MSWWLANVGGGRPSRHSLPGVVRETSDREAAIAGLVEHLQRGDPPFFEEAEGYRRLLEEFHLSHEDVAAHVGKSRRTVANKLRLLRLEPSVRAQVSRVLLSERHARALLSLETEQERPAAVEVFGREGFSVAQAEAWLRRKARNGGAPSRRARSRGVVRDSRIYLNAVDEVAKQLQAAGFSAEVTRDEDESGWTVHLRIKRRRSRQDGKRR